MKKLTGLLMLALVLTACNNDGAETKTEQKLDSLSEKIDTTLDKAWDTTKVRAKALKEKIREKLDNDKDSIKAKDSL